MTDEYGEVIDIIESKDKYVKLYEGDRVLRKGAIQYLNDTVDIKYHFIKVNPYVYSDIANKFPIINTLIRYVGYMDGKISYDNGRAVKLKDVSKLCNVSLSTAKRQIKGLVESDVLHKVKDKRRNTTFLVMNPFVAFIGRRIDLSLYEEFKLSEYRSKCKEWSK